MQMVKQMRGCCAVALGVIYTASASSINGPCADCARSFLGSISIQAQSLSVLARGPPSAQRLAAWLAPAPVPWSMLGVRPMRDALGINLHAGFRMHGYRTHRNSLALGARSLSTSSSKETAEANRKQNQEKVSGQGSKGLGLVNKEVYQDALQCAHLAWHRRHRLLPPEQFSDTERSLHSSFAPDTHLLHTMKRLLQFDFRKYCKR